MKVLQIECVVHHLIHITRQELVGPDFELHNEHDVVYDYYGINPAAQSWNVELQEHVASPGQSRQGALECVHRSQPSVDLRLIDVESGLLSETADHLLW